MARINRDTPPELIARALDGLGLSLRAAADAFCIDPDTLARYRRLGAPRLVHYALIGLAVERDQDPDALGLLPVPGEECPPSMTSMRPFLELLGLDASPTELAPEEAQAVLARLGPLLDALRRRSRGDLLSDGGAAATGQTDS
jgi:hypothetical protein